MLPVSFGDLTTSRLGSAIGTTITAATATSATSGATPGSSIVTAAITEADAATASVNEWLAHIFLMHRGRIVWLIGVDGLLINVSLLSGSLVLNMRPVASLMRVSRPVLLLLEGLRG